MGSIMVRYSAHGNHSRSGQQPVLRSDMAAYNASNYVGHSARRPKNHKRRNIIIVVVVAVILILGCSGVALAMSAKDAKADAEVLMDQGKTLVTQLKEGDKTGAGKTATELSATAKKLNDTVGSPLWAAATLIPVYGSDIAQVRTIASVADTLCAKAVTPLINALPAEGLSGIVVDGGVNVEAVEDMLAPLGAEYPTIHDCAEQVARMGDSHLEQLKEPVQTVKGLVGTLDTVSEYASELSHLLPGMLGADGEPAHYLVIAANNAEPRSTGGMAGSFGIMTVEDGKMSMGDFVGSETAPRPDTGEAALPLTDEELLIFGKRVGMDMRDVGYIPNFPRVAELQKAIWESSGNTKVDGIVMLDPVFLQRILALTGGVTTSNGTVVDGTNAAQILMNEVYLRYGDENEIQDAFFAEVASAALDQVLGNLGEVDLAKLLEVVNNSLDDRRFYIWMANPEEEAIVTKLGAAGLTSVSETEPVAGIYFGAASGAKSFWYLDADAQVSEGRKNADGSMSYDVTVTFSNTLNDAAASDMSWYITGEAAIKRSVSDMHLDVYLYAPAGGSISNMQTNGYFFDSSYFGGEWYTTPGPDEMTKASYNDNEVWYGITGINGGESTTISYTVTTSPKAETSLQIDMTPLANEAL